jgi:hypothetical protein
MASLVKKILGSIDEILIRDNFIYLPLLFDREIEKEIESNEQVIKANEKFFVKAIGIDTIVKNFDKIYKEAYSSIEEELCKKIFSKEIPAISTDKNYRILNALIFEVMPYFCPSFARIRNEKEKKEAVINAIEEYQKRCIKEKYIEKYRQIASKLLNETEQVNLLKKLEVNEKITFPEGMVKASSLENMLKEAVEIEIITKKKKELEESVKAMKETNTRYLASILFLKDAGDFEFENFGFEKQEGCYLTYVKLKEYALKDFDGRIYLFPPCRVGTCVTLSGEVHEPIVVDRYKHPFLESYAQKQKICIVDFELKGDTIGKRIISAIEQGISTLLYGYYSRDFIGYRYLDGTTRRGPEISFSEYRISEDDPRIKSGEITITNAPFIK